MTQDFRISNRESICKLCRKFIRIGDKITFTNPHPKVRARIAVHLDCLIRANTDSGLNSAKHGIATMPGEKVN